MIGLKIDNNSNEPIYRQLYHQLSRKILKGELEGDFNLPPIRTSAKELRVSIITVKKAWEDLERDGFIYTITGKGCFVKDFTLKEREELIKQRIMDQLKRDLQYYQGLEIERDDLIKMITELYPEL